MSEDKFIDILVEEALLDELAEDRFIDELAEEAATRTAPDPFD